MKKIILLSFFFSTLSLIAQELPYKTILEAPETITAGNVASRMADGLGFRFYWATEGLTAEDLAFGPEGEGRSIKETVAHVHTLALFALYALKNEPLTRYDQIEDFNELREAALNSIKEVSDKLRSMTTEEIESVNFQGLPFWNLINGPIADAIYHTGQIVVLRRMSGNPMNPKVNVLRGVTGN